MTLFPIPYPLFTIPRVWVWVMGGGWWVAPRLKLDNYSSCQTKNLNIYLCDQMIRVAVIIVRAMMLWCQTKTIQMTSVMLNEVSEGFCNKFSREKFLPPQSDSGSVPRSGPRSGPETNIGGSRPRHLPGPSTTNI